jgi:hippurate hydrolase
LLAADPAPGDVVILLQPAEEVGQGAARVLADGALAGVTAIAGAHVDLRFPIGTVVADVGPLAASTDEFRITVIGLGGHAARPHEARDPIPAAAAIAIALQALTPDRRMDGDAAVCTVTQVHAGTAWNVIPERAELGGTLRATTPAARARLKSSVREIATSCAAQHHLEAEVTIVDGTPPLVNAAEPVAWARDVVTALLGPNALVPLPEPNLAGEDFASYAEQLPAVFLRIGAREPHEPVVGAHSPRFLPSDAAIPVGALTTPPTTPPTNRPTSPPMNRAPNQAPRNDTAHAANGVSSHASTGRRSGRPVICGRRPPTPPPEAPRPPHRPAPSSRRETARSP